MPTNIPNTLQTANGGRSFFVQSPGGYGSFSMVGPGEVEIGLYNTDGPPGGKSFRMSLRGGKVYLEWLTDDNTAVAASLLMFDAAHAFGPGLGGTAAAPVALIAKPDTRSKRMDNAPHDANGIQFPESAYAVDMVTCNGFVLAFGIDYDEIPDPASHGRALGVKPLKAVWTPGDILSVRYSTAPALTYSL
jgi:hypothetical protein